MAALRLAWLAVVRRRWSLLLIITPTAVLFGLVTLLVSLEGTLRAYSLPGLDERTVRITPRRGLLSHADVEQMTKIPGAAEWSATMGFDCVVDPAQGKLPGCRGMNATGVKLFAPLMYVPPQVIEQWDRQRNGALVGKETADRYGWHVGQQISLPTRQGPTLSVQIVYIADQGSKIDPVWVHLEYTEDLERNSKDLYRGLWLVVDDPTRRAAIMDAIEARFEDSGTPVEVVPAEVARAGLLGASKLLIVVFRGAGLLAIALVVFTSLTTLTLSIESRRRELATLRAIGCRRLLLVRLILAESILLLAPGAILGGLLTYLWFYGRGLRLSDVTTVTVSLAHAAIATLIGVALGALVALVPARRAAETDVLKVLRDS